MFIELESEQQRHQDANEERERIEHERNALAQRREVFAQYWDEVRLEMMRTVGAAK